MLWKFKQSTQLKALHKKTKQKWHLEQSEPQTTNLQVLDDANQHILDSGQFLLKQGRKVIFVDHNQQTKSWQQKVFKFADQVEADELKAILTDLVDIRLIEPVARLAFEQSQLIWRDDEQKAVVKANVYQQGELQFLQLLPIRGYAKAHSWLQQQLTEIAGKAQKQSLWQTLLANSNFQPSNLRESTIKASLGDMPKASTPAQRAILQMAAPMLRVARMHEDGIKAKPQDIEYLHDYRVCLRKVRSLLSLFKSCFAASEFTKLKIELGDLARRTNELRDLDVYLLEQDSYSAMLPTHLRAGLPAMFDDFAKQQRSARSQVKRWLNSKAYSSLMISILDRMENPDACEPTENGDQAIAQLVKQKIRKRYQKIAKLGAAITPATPDDEVHELRIECKKFRYLLEFFKPFYPKTQITALIKRLKKLQDTLGQFNDFSVQQESLTAYLAEHTEQQQVAMSVGALLAILAQKQLEQRQQVETKFAEFADQQTAQLIHELFG